MTTLLPLGPARWVGATVLAGACASPAARESLPVIDSIHRATLASASDDFVRSVAVARDGRYVLGGYTRSPTVDASVPSATTPQWGALLYTMSGPDQQQLALTSGGSDYVQSVTFDDHDGLFAAGYTTGGFVKPAGGHDAFLAKFDASGVAQWIQQWGSAADDDVYGVALTQAGVLVAGYTEGELSDSSSQGGTDAFVSLISREGAHLSTVQFGSPGNDYVQDVASATDGGWLVVGYTDGVFEGVEGVGGNDVFVARYASDGTRTSLLQWGTPQTDYGLGVANDSDHSVVVGYTYGTLDGHTAAGKEDAFAVAFNTQGAVIWQHQWGGKNNDNARSVALDARGVAWVVGDSQTTSTSHRSTFLRAFDQLGNLVAQQTWPAEPSTFAMDIAIDTSADTFMPLVLAGYTQNTTASGAPLRDAWALTSHIEYR